MPSDIPFRCASSQQRTVKGLATLALLKANFDKGRDHLSMFEPFVLDTIAALPKDDFEVQQLRDLLFKRHGLAMPEAVLRTLLSRAARRKAVKLAAGKYFRNLIALKDTDITAVRCQIETEHAQLANALQQFAALRNAQLSTEEDALSLLLGFLVENDVPMLLDGEAPVEGARRGALSSRETRLVARFINEVCLPDAQLKPCLQRVMEGLVLQNALLLKDIATASRRFIGLQIFLDSGFLFRALGFTGEPTRLVTRECLDLLRATGAVLAVFDKTVDEMKRIFALYEHRLGTSQGRESLWPTDLTRYFLTERYSPADVRQATVFIENNLRSLGLAIRSTPERRVRYTLDEADLTKRMKRAGTSDKDRIEDRVQHDVDCVAAILTIREGRCPDSLDNAKAVFVTTSRKVLQKVKKWWHDSGEPGIPPIIHDITLSNAAWLKRPSAATELKLQELVALCAAALRPSRDAWKRFLVHLRRLENSAELSSDEAVAVLASRLTDNLLADAEDLEVSTLNEVVDRVITTYKAEAKRSVILAEARTESEAEQSRQLEMRITSKVNKAARIISLIPFVLMGLVVVFGSVVGLPASYPDLGPLGSVLGLVSAAFVTILGVISTIRGDLRALRLSIERRLQRKLRSWLLGHPSNSLPGASRSADKE